MKYLRWLLGLFLLLLAAASYDARKSSPESIPVARAVYEHTPLQGRDYVYYTIQPGDTLAILQRRFRIPSDRAILALNPDLDPDRLPVNRRIKISLQ